MLRTQILSTVLLFILVPSSVSAGSRLDGIENLLNESRKSTSGFADSPSEQISISSTSASLEIAAILGLQVSDQLDILLYYQESQNTDGGFSVAINGNSDWETTIRAISGLRLLGINSTQLDRWRIYEFINSTAADQFYSEVTEGNTTYLVPNELNLVQIELWKEYIIAAVLTANFPSVPFIYLSNELTNLQFSNGSYESFDLATSTIQLLGTLDLLPNEVISASKYIRAFEQADHLFSSTNTDQTSIKDTYQAISALNALNRIVELEFKKEIILKILSMQDSNNGFMESNEEKPTVSSTWYAVQILLMLNALDELESPDVLQTQGFISVGLFAILLGIVSLPVLRRQRRKSYE